ncbi:MAG: hypothetical protein RL685_513 [Pseudomonadota bacterium]|jgi:hypothetical protein
MPEGLRLEARQAQSNFQRMVTEVGEDGCGWEASLESWYRFLIDPVPYGELVRVMCRNSTSQAELRSASDGQRQPHLAR